MAFIDSQFVIELRAFEEEPVFASSGTIPVDVTDPVQALEVLFGWFNHGSPTEVEFYHRSLSVGDVVHLGETSWRCASVGWERDR